MADGDIDISGMPDPATVGLSPQAQTDPTASMPSPAELYQKFYGYPTNSPIDLDEFMKHPPDESRRYKGQGLGQGIKDTLSSFTGAPRAAAGALAAVPAGVASVAGQASGALDATLALAGNREDLITPALERGNQRGREWAEKVSKLADYVPATQEGAELSSGLLGLPGQAIKGTADATLKPLLSDNAYQALGEVGQDIGTDLPALGAPAMLRAGARAVRPVTSKVTEAARTAADALNDKPEKIKDAQAKAEAASAPLTPDVSGPVTPESLRAQPNPIPPPDGTVAAARSATKRAPAPAAPAAAPEAPTEATAPVQVPAAAPTQVPAGTETAPTVGTPSPGDAQRGSARLFNPPSKEGPQGAAQEGGPTPEDRQAHLDALDKLSGGALPTRRLSALSGDYNATGDDFQMKEVGNEQMRQQLATENAALHKAANNVHDSVGSQFENSVDSQTLGDRGRVTRNAIQAIEQHFGDATDAMYDAARTANQGRPIPELTRVKAYLNDDSNFTNDAEIGLQKAAKLRMDRLWSTGDPDKGAPPGSVNAAERLREFLNEKGKNPNAMGVASDLKNHLDMDVAEHGGPGLFQTARNLRRHQYQMLEEPTGIKKLLAPADSQGINHAIPEHKVMDYIADLSREQHEHVLNVLRAGAHLDPELAKTSAAAIREIQAHAISRIHAAATDSDGTWNARKFYNAADRYARNMPDTFKDRPDVLKNLQTLGDAGNTLHMDKHYPGAAAQTERTGAVGHALETGGHIVASVAHEIPIVGRFVGRKIEAAAERASGKVAESARDREIAKRLVDRNGKQRGSVQVLRDAEDETPPVRLSGSSNGVSAYSPGGVTSTIRRGNDLHVKASETNRDARGKGEGTARLETLAQQAHATGGKLVSDHEVSAPEQKLYQKLADKGYDVKTNPHTTDLGTGVKKSTSELKGVYEVGPRASEPVKVPSAQRGSVQLFNDNPLNRSAGERVRSGVPIRNERSEYNANSQIAGGPRLNAEQNDILRRLSGQRGSVKVMSEPEQREVIDHFTAPENQTRLRKTVAQFKKQHPSMWAYHLNQAAKQADVEPKEMWERIVKRLAK